MKNPRVEKVPYGFSIILCFGLVACDGIYKMAELLNKELTEENEAECDEYGEKLTQVYDECAKEVSDGCGIE